MIPAISSINTFKGLYINNEGVYSASQKRTIDDIKKKLLERASSRDFYIEQNSQNDSVNLYELARTDTKEGSKNVNKFSQSNLYLVGSYNENSPFDIERFDKDDRKRGYTAAIILGAILASFILLIGSTMKGCLSSQKQKPVIKTELIEKLDSLKNILHKNLK